ncbi:ABC transporter permease [bacterium]|uniref:ABC transporter permease n=1 Tax=Lachnospiraceae TaxID=186803 RepID=UPI002A31A7E2|nr:ABC transporter permease [bacterium]MDD6514714.1 ABC transporter permease [bacterium]MDD7142609.1 ABC transporter permease [bacterium]MDY4504601.1 ABC transporter permease [Bariatricus sp.]MDY5458064.1 ABC transporter permease [Bariatricus sp.]
MKTFWKSKYSRLGICILLVLTFFTVLVPFLPFYDPVTQNADLRNAGSSLMHLFGTDKFGRDIFSRVWYGAGISMKVGILASLISSIVGLLYGGIAGYAGKKTDMIMMQAADIVDSIPSLLYVILFMLLFGASVKTVILGICISGWTRMARVVRGEILRLKEMDYILAARLEGSGAMRILIKQMLPNLKEKVILNAVLLVPEAIFTEAFLSFLGVGIAAPAASLGTLIQEARSQMQIYPTQMMWPVLVLVLLIFSLNLIVREN